MLSNHVSWDNSYPGGRLWIHFQLCIFSRRLSVTLTDSHTILLHWHKCNRCRSWPRSRPSSSADIDQRKPYRFLRSGFGSTPITSITIAFFSMIHFADCFRSLSSSKHCSLLCSHVIWLSVKSIVVFLLGLSSDSLGASRVLDSCVRCGGHIHRRRRTDADGRWRFWRWSRESFCDFRLKLSYRKSENKPPFRGCDGLIPGSGWTWLPCGVADEMNFNKVVHLELYLEFSDTSKALRVYTGRKKSTLNSFFCSSSALFHTTV